MSKEKVLADVQRTKVLKKKKEEEEVEEEEEG